MNDSSRSSSYKPTGLDLLVTLALISGVIDVLGAVLFLLVTSVSLSWLEMFVGPKTVKFVVLIVSLISIVLLICGASSFVQAYGLWDGRGWAWTWTRSSAIVGLAASIIALSVGIGMMGVASNMLTLYYLTRTEVKAFFGKAALPESKSLPNLCSMFETFCVRCGNRFNGNEAYCSSCGCKR